jgi:hypothetical protein
VISQFSTFPVLGIAFFSGKQKNSKGEDVSGYTGSYNGNTQEYKITQVLNEEFKNALKRVQNGTDYWSKLASDNGGVLSGIHFDNEDKGATKIEVLISGLSAGGASNVTTTGTTPDSWYCFCSSSKYT